MADRGRPSHSLLTVLGSDIEAAAVDLDVRRARDLPREVELGRLDAFAVHDPRQRPERPVS